ncbi:hypothetical protein [Lentibacillus cibarius]|uniref:Uncharacterized protein n=1 Tax=Lentibacillus cibarius TaxID=2583219 RepID=A0A5S3QG84_9BACI|nr:hypothetical protein [Lentibacillus cibarius]TMN20817.1 hypothetical protein FFL34_00850 [Lentibacillus cibarius]
MAKIIPFQTRAQLEQKKRDKVWADWEEWLEFEEYYLHQELTTNNDHVPQEDQENDKKITEQEIIEDVRQHLTDEEMQKIKAFDAWLQQHTNK